jgi:hypothetical protein
MPETRSKASSKEEMAPAPLAKVNNRQRVDEGESVDLRVDLVLPSGEHRVGRALDAQTMARLDPLQRLPADGRSALDREVVQGFGEEEVGEDHRQDLSPVGGLQDLPGLGVVGVPGVQGRDQDHGVDHGGWGH